MIRNIDHEGLVQTAERFRMLVEKTSVPTDRGTINVTISVGVTLARPDDTIGSLLERADGLLYRSKDEGRNRVTTEAEMLRAVSDER